MDLGMKSKRFSKYFPLFLMILILTGCGGGGGGGGTPGPVVEPPVQAGEKTNPIALTYPGSFPHGDSIAIDDLGKYYKISGLVPGQDYKLTISSSDSIRINVYDYADYTSNSCKSLSGCVIGANSDGEAFVEVELYYPTETKTAYSFTLGISDTNFEGSINSPVDVTSTMPYSNTMPADLSGYYRISGLTPGNRYSFSLVLPSGSDSDLFAYQDGFVSQACSSTYTTNGSDELCSFTAASDSAWIKIRGNEGGAFELTMTDNGLGRSYTSSGSIGGEVELTLSSASSSEVDYTASYYHISGLDSAKQYRTVVEPTWYDDNVDIYVYSDASYSNQLCSATSVEPKTEVCLSGTSASGELWIKVDGSVAHNELGQDYSIRVDTYYPNEGSSSDRVQLSFGAGNILHTGTVDTKSYYQINGLVAGQSYVVDIKLIDNTLTDFTVAGANPQGYFTADCEGSVSGELLTCIAEAKSDGTLGVIVENDYLYTGAGFEMSVSLSTYQSEGTSDAPLNLAFGSVDLPHSGTIGGAPSYYVITGLTIDQAYTISMNGVPAHGLKVYTAGADVPSAPACIVSYPDSTGYSQCTVRALTNSLWVMVEDNYLGGAFTLDAVHSPYQAEGSLATPQDIALGADPKQGVTRQSTVSVDASYYKLTGLTIGETYAVAIRNFDGAYSHYPYVYDNAAAFGSTTYGDYVCRQFVSSTSTEDYCLVTASDTSLWLMVAGNTSSSGAMYDINVRLKPETEAVTLDYSVGGTFPRASSVGLTDSTYTITGLETDELYEVSLSTMTDDVDISSCSTNDGLTAELCVMKADASGEISVTVRSGKTLYGAYFTLGITTGNVNEGTSADPTLLDTSVITLPVGGQVGSGESFYKVTGLSADAMHEVHLTEPTANVDVIVYEDSTFTSTWCTSQYSSTSGNRVCGGISTPAGELYFSVKVRSPYLGANYNLNVVPGLSREGSIGAEVQLAYGTSAIPHSGSVDLSYSYYEITGLSGGTEYYVVLNDRTDQASFYVYQDAAYSLWTCNGSFECLATTKNGSTSLFVRVSGGSTMVGAEYSLEVLPAPVSEGSASTPVVLDYNVVSVTPYEGQVDSEGSGDASYSYYRLDNLTAGTGYTVSMETYPELADLNVYTSAADLTSGISACTVGGSSSGTPQVCNVVSTGTSLWIKIGNPYVSSFTYRTGTYFTLYANTNP